MLFAVACSEPGPPIFGTADTVCESVRLLNEDGDLEKMASASSCLLGEIDAGRAITVDIATITAEGDPIYNRYAFDGESVLIVADDRADTFGNGGVRAERCASIQAGRFLPEGIDCQSADHDGFPEATS